MSGWATTVLAAIIAASAFFIWRRVRGAAADRERVKTDDALREAENAQDDKDRDFERARRDDTLLGRLRALRREKTDAGGDVQG